MRQITSISDDSKQAMSIVLDNGEKIAFSLEYISNQRGWFMSFVYGDRLTVKGHRIVTSPNMLRAFKESVPFGISCVTNDKQEPINLDDFSTGRCTLYLLNSDDVEDVENNIIPAYRT